MLSGSLGEDGDARAEPSLISGYQSFQLNGGPYPEFAEDPGLLVYNEVSPSYGELCSPSWLQNPLDAESRRSGTLLRRTLLAFCGDLPFLFPRYLTPLSPCGKGVRDRRRHYINKTLP